MALFERGESEGEFLTAGGFMSILFGRGGGRVRSGKGVSSRGGKFHGPFWEGRIRLGRGEFLTEGSFVTLA